MNRSLPPFTLGLLLFVAALVAALWAHLPLVNGPQEWQWAYRPPGLAVAGLAAALAGAALVLLAATGGEGNEKWRLSALLAGGTFFTFGLVAAQPDGFGRVLDSLVSRNSFGFVWDAGLAPGNGALLADYPAASRDLNQHSVTHPPGPLLAVRALDRLVSRLAPSGPPDRPEGPGQPGASGGAAGAARTAREGPAGTWLGERAARAIARARMRAGYHGQQVPQRMAGAWTVAVLALLLPAASVLAAWPLNRLALACGLGHRAALLAAALWMLVPARSLFTPSLDQTLPLLILSAAWLAARPTPGRAAAAGATLCCACFLSWGCLAALPIVGALAVAAALTPRDLPRAQAVAVPAAALALGFLLPWVFLALGTGFDPWRALRTALGLHHEIAVAPRGYGTWLLFNPWDFALLAGLPIVLPAAAARSAATRRPALRALYWSFWAVMAALWLSGSVRGEVGRIWLPWMPFACLLAAAALVPSEWVETVPAPTPAPWLLLAEAALALTLAANLVFVT